MPATSAVIARLKEAGFAFDEEREHAVFLRKIVDGGRPLIIRVQRKRELDPATVRALLKQAGVPRDDVEAFLRACTS